MNKRKSCRLTKPQQLWLKMLRSGKYEKGRYALQPAEGGYCCLGVAVLAYEEATGEKLPRDRNRLVGGALGGPYEKVALWLDLNDTGGMIRRGGIALSRKEKFDALTNLNDATKDKETLYGRRRDRFSFRDIAALIRQHADKIFVATKNRHSGERS